MTDIDILPLNIKEIISLLQNFVSRNMKETLLNLLTVFVQMKIKSTFQNSYLSSRVTVWVTILAGSRHLILWKIIGFSTHAALSIIWVAQL